MHLDREEFRKELKRAIGRAIGRHEGLRAAAERVVESRFGSVPDELRTRIATSNDAWCERLIVTAVRAQSITELSLL